MLRPSCTNTYLKCGRCCLSLVVSVVLAQKLMKMLSCRTHESGRPQSFCLPFYFSIALLRLVTRSVGTHRTRTSPVFQYMYDYEPQIRFARAPRSAAR